MCILFIYTNPNPNLGKYQLIIATNRDEYFIRPAAAAHKWPEDEQIIAGKDMEPGREGGTWFGSSFRSSLKFKFRAAALLNITGEERHTGAAGRGKVVTDYLMGDLTAEEYIKEHLKPHAKTFNAFSFVAVELGDDIPKIFHYSNVTDTISTYHNNEPTIVGFGNSPPHEPLAKVIAGEQKFRSIIIDEDLNSTNLRTMLLEKLRLLLRWDERHLPDNVLARRSPQTFEQLSSIFVNINGAYGTRTHTFILADANSTVNFLEETMDYSPEIPSSESKWTTSSYELKF